MNKTVLFLVLLAGATLATVGWWALPRPGWPFDAREAAKASPPVTDICPLRVDGSEDCARRSGTVIDGHDTSRQPQP
jgi:hypothetical protein